MRLLGVASTLVLLSACGMFASEPKFELEPQLACTEDMLFDADLTSHLVEGPGDGTFDYDPTGEFATRIDGSYDLSTGDFVYETEYDADAWMKKAEVEGYGFAKENGDLDVRYTSVRTDVHDEATTLEVRLEREACHQTVRYFDADSGVEVVEEGDYTAEGYVYTRNTPVDGEDDQVVEGVLHEDLTWEDALEWSTDDLDYAFEREGDADGYSISSWEQHEADWDYEGTTENFLDGSRREHMEGDGADGSSFVQDWEVDFDGNGDGTYEAGDVECDLEFDEWACTYDCGRYGTGEC